MLKYSYRKRFEMPLSGPSLSGGDRNLVLEPSEARGGSALSRNGPRKSIRPMEIYTKLP